MNHLKSYLFTLFLLFIYSNSYSQRNIIGLNTNWHFILQDNSEYSKLNFDDFAWQKIDIPHDWAF